MEYLQYSIYSYFIPPIYIVLNLIINGIPSIQKDMKNLMKRSRKWSFKPYYKWNTFNTFDIALHKKMQIHRFKPYYKWNTFNTVSGGCIRHLGMSFKPYYKWNTFNTFK